MRGRSIIVVALTALAACTGDTGTEAPTSPEASPSAAAAPDLGDLDPDTVIAYQRTADGVPRLFLTRADGTDDHDPFPDLPGLTQHPDFSRDGRFLAFDQLDDEGATDQVFVADADGANARLLVPCDVEDRCFQRWEPAWSPTGDRLAISTSDGTGNDLPYPSVFGIAVVDVATGELTQVVSTRGMQDHYPRWSPDGSRLVFWRERAADGGSVDTAVFVVNVDGSGLRRLTPWSMDAANPDWAPDRDELVFSIDSLIDPPDDVPAVLVTMRPDGSQLRAVSTLEVAEGQATHPRWTPDGEAIVYSHVPLGEVAPRQVWLMAADGGDDRALLVAWEDAVHPTMQP